MNVGPTADGRIEPIFEERLLQMGQWLEVNGDAVYQTKPWKTAQNDSLTRDVYYTQSTSSHETVFAIFFNWPQNNVSLSCVDSLILTLLLFRFWNWAHFTPIPAPELRSSGKI